MPSRHSGSSQAAAGTLVGDIGGTNARFAIMGADGPAQRRVYLCAEHADVEAAIGTYLAESGLAARPKRVALAVAGPVLEGRIVFTNNHWRISEAALLAAGFEQARLINDFAALAMAVPYLRPADLAWLGGPRTAPADATAVVLGPGTGFGIAALVRDRGRQAVATTEGGHVAFAPHDELEMEVLRILKRQFTRVSVERLLSGPGLTNLHQALAIAEGRVEALLDAAEITRLARTGDEVCLRTARRFCGILGSVAGDAVLALGARGGAYLAGGVAAKMADLIAGSEFRQRFEDKGRFAGYNQAVPTWLLHSADAALLGAAFALND